MDKRQTSRTALLSFRLGASSFFLGPVTGIPAIAVGFFGLREVRRSAARLRGKGLAGFGILAGLLGTALVPVFLIAIADELLWPDLGKRIDRIFRDLERERFDERQDGIWPAFRAVAPQSIYIAAENKWPRPTRLRVLVGGIMRLPSGAFVHFEILDDAAEPIIAMGKPAVPHLFKWAMHDDLHIRYVALHALEEITGKRIEIPGFSYVDKEDAQGHREKAIQMWQEWYEKQP